MFFRFWRSRVAIARVVRRLGPRRARAFGLAVLVVGAAVASGTGSAGLQPVESAAAKAGGAVTHPSLGTVTITDSGNWTINLTSGPGATFGYIETASSNYQYRATETIRIPACAVSRPGTRGCLATAADHSSPPAVVVGSPTLTATGSATSTLTPNAPASDAIPCDGRVQPLPVSIGNNPTLVNAPIQVHFALHQMWVYVAPPATWMTISGETPPGVTPATECPGLGGHSLLQWNYEPVTGLNKVLPKTFTYGPPSPLPQGESVTGSSTITITGGATPCTVTPGSSAGAASARASGRLDAHPADACPHVALRVSPSTTTLDHDVGLQATLTPKSPPATDYDWQIKRPDAPRWTTFASTHGNRLKFDAQVAGNLLVRVIASGPGVDEVSSPEKLVVQFPSAAEILADRTIAQATTAAWATMIGLVTKTTVQEVGFWIYIDSCTGKYGYTPPDFKKGDPAPPTVTDIGINLGNRPRDKPADPPVTRCATYYIASFHTHTAETYAPTNKARPVGPSDTDNTLAKQLMVPGLVYDYKPEPGCAAQISPPKPCISGGWPEGKPAIIEPTRGLDRRPVSTTPESS
jgi:hypothetical protein